MAVIFFKELFTKKISCEDNISASAKMEIERLIKGLDNALSPLEQMWSMMDDVWKEYGCDNSAPCPEKLGLFYSHPVWLLNGFFIESDPTSMGHRKSIADWIEDRQKDGYVDTILDFGGGFGTLALEIAKRSCDLQVVIYEPFPSEFALERTRQFSNISWTTLIPRDTFSCVVSTDVLEHDEKPLNLLESMISALYLNGYLIIANNFTPCIKCHLPGTFYLRRTFRFAAWALGLQYMEPCKGSHAQVFKKSKGPTLSIKKSEHLCRALAPILDSAAFIKRTIKQVNS